MLNAPWLRLRPWLLPCFVGAFVSLGGCGSGRGIDPDGQGGSAASGQGGSGATGQGGSAASGQGGSATGGQAGSAVGARGGSSAGGQAGLSRDRHGGRNRRRVTVGRQGRRRGLDRRHRRTRAGGGGQPVHRGRSVRVSDRRREDRRPARPADGLRRQQRVHAGQRLCAGERRHRRHRPARRRPPPGMPARPTPRRGTRPGGSTSARSRRRADYYVLDMDAERPFVHLHDLRPGVPGRADPGGPDVLLPARRPEQGRRARRGRLDRRRQLRRADCRITSAACSATRPTPPPSATSGAAGTTPGT